MVEMKIKKNIYTSLISQIVTIVYGLIVPRIILQTFGSEVNGLVSSISQFLNYIPLLEGGVSSVIMAALYKPLAENDEYKINAVVKAATLFFRKIALIFIAYLLGVAIVYPIFVDTSFSWEYVFSLALIIGITLFIQYFFSLTYRLLITASQNGYIVYLAQIGITIINFILTIIVVRVYPEIHILKIANVIAYIIQPIIFNYYVQKKFKINSKVLPDENALKQRWNGFGQNLAFFIHTNTDIVVLTIFCSLIDVSIYSVYFMIIGSLKNMVMSISSAIVPSVGNTLVGDDIARKNIAFDMYEYGISLITSFAFGCGIVLIVPFVNVYTMGIRDANYFQPLFGIILMIAEAIYCYRDPYVSVAYASGHFKETALYAYLEAAMNIIISIILVIKFGLIGVAIGTFVSMLYRMVSHAIYLKKNILFRSLKKFLVSIAESSIVIVCCVIMACLALYRLPETYFEWIGMAIVTSIITAIFIFIIQFLFNRKKLSMFIKILRK